MTTYEVTAQWSGTVPAHLAGNVARAVAKAIADYGEPGAEHVWTKVRGQYTITRVSLNPVPIAVIAAIITTAVAAVLVIAGLVLIAYWFKEAPEVAAISLGALIALAAILYMLKGSR